MISFLNVEAVEGDITDEQTDVIVNAANNTLLGGGGVDGAIHRCAGPDLLEECRLLGGCKTGEAKITKGYRLKAKYVIHTVGPVWRGGTFQEEELLRLCYRNSLSLAESYQLRSVSFPSISTGVYGYPLELAAPAVIDELLSIRRQNLWQGHRIRLVCFDHRSFDLYRTLIEKSNFRSDK